MRKTLMTYAVLCAYAGLLWVSGAIAPALGAQGGLPQCVAELDTCVADLGTCNDDLAVCEAAVCGNEVAESGEACDGENLQGATCGTEGFLYGVLACTASCTIDTSGCTNERYVDNQNGTVTDNEKGLMWEQKRDGGSIHNKDDVYTWTDLGDGDPTNPDGTAFTVFLWTLNNTCRGDETIACVGDADCAVANGGPGGPCGFAGYRDWRLPEVDQDGGKAELETILLPSCPGSVPCIDETIFGRTAAALYWTSVTGESAPNGAWAVTFLTGDVGLVFKDLARRVRAVRGP